MDLRSLLIPLLSVLLLCGCKEASQDAQDNNIPVDLEIANTLSNLRINSIAEDRNGYIWMATSRGLNRYNGDDMHQYFCNDQPNSIPDNRINTVFCDSKGRIWVTTKNGVARYTEQDDFEQIPISYSNPRCQMITENSRGDIFVIQTNVVLKYNGDNNTFEKVISNVSYVDPFMQKSFMDEEDNIWIIDDHNVECYSTITFQKLEKLEPGENAEIQTAQLIGRLLWIADNTGIRLYDVIAHQWREVPTAIRAHSLYNKSRVLAIIPAQEEEIIICTLEGIFVYNAITGTFIFQDEARFPFTAPSFKVNLGICDSKGNLWLCSESQGYSMLEHHNNLFSNRSPFVNRLVGEPVVSMTLQQEKTLWIATQDNGLYSYDLQSREFSHYTTNTVTNVTANAPKRINRRVNCLYADKSGYLWASTTPKGLVQLKPNGKNLVFVNYYHLPVIIELKEDKEGTIWAGCYGNSYFSKRKNDKEFLEHHLFSNTFSYLSCMQLLRDSSFVTLERGVGLRYIDTRTQEQTAPVIPDSVLQSCIARSIFLPSSLKEGQDGSLWIGTISNGLMRYDPKEQTLENIQGAPCDDIASIEVDKDGNLWVSTQYGLGKYNVETQSFTNYYSTDGLGGNEYFDRSSCQLPDGTLVFGGPHGVTIFNPKDISEELSGTIRLEDLKVNNQLVRPRQGQAIDKRLDLCDAIRLNYTQNNFSISFSSLDFSQNERFNFQYKLDCVNAHWVEANHSREANYANLGPGEYTFHARITNKDGDKVIAETSMPVTIEAPLWGSKAALLFYLLCTCSIIYYIVRLYRRVRKEKWDRLQSQREKAQEQHINRMNMNFFANVSHEFRTPLTVISGPISQLCQNPDIKGDDHHLLMVVNRSVDRMLHLVNQMMDFHKLENDSLRLEVKRQDIIGSLKQTAEFFAVNAKDKNITFTTRGLDDYFLMWMDADKIDKIMNNLVGNAMKYTPAKGEVQLSFDVVTSEEVAREFEDPASITDTQYVKICVTDNGKGIPADQREKIFKRYYQLQNRNEGTGFNLGTGIGLYYARSLAVLHHGALHVYDNPDGQGSQFCLVLPINKTAYRDGEFADQAQNQNELFPLEQSVKTAVRSVEENVPTPDDDAKPHVLVVDDDVEVIHYLKLLLNQHYRVTCRFDAVTALETLQRQDQEIDLIISDVMMPGTTGYQLCQQVKADAQLCHIPVILVTAKTTVQDQIEGLNAGALAYVTKPFDPTYLSALIQRLLDSRNHTRQLLQENTQTEALDENALSAQDNAFMTELYRLMEEELANPDMDITRMTELLHISRSKLYYKIKGLTGENPSVFFKQYKLNRAAELLKEGKYNISEISLLTGFNTLSHFSTSFKKQFGVTPSDY